MEPTAYTGSLCCSILLRIVQHFCLKEAVSLILVSCPTALCSRGQEVAAHWGPCAAGGAEELKQSSHRRQTVSSEQQERIVFIVGGKSKGR
jgi:hypothetical protein